MKLCVILLPFLLTIVYSYDNGLGRVPPMGWFSWSSFKCEVDCKSHPKSCINQNLYQETADAMVTQGFLAAGYRYVNIDDCWSEKKRINQQMVPDHERFPQGMKALADYIHSKGLLFGLYSDIGTKTCAKYPGHLNEKGKSPENFFDIDAKTFANWGIDSLKVDGCNVSPSDMDPLYESLSLSLNSTKRPIFLWCSGPFFQATSGHFPTNKIDFARYRQHCNGWRFYDDIWPTDKKPWKIVLEIIDFWKANIDTYEKYHGPGSWFDPDALIIGNGLLTHSQEEAQMAIWSIMAAPLLMSNDVRNISQSSKDILLNRHIIQVNQDRLGLPGKPVFIMADQEVWVKQLVPAEPHKKETFAVVYFNRGNSTVTMSPSLGQILPPTSTVTFDVYDLFRDAQHIGSFHSNQEVSLQVPPTGVRMIKVVGL